MLVGAPWASTRACQSQAIFLCVLEIKFEQKTSKWKTRSFFLQTFLLSCFANLRQMNIQSFITWAPIFPSLLAVIVGRIITGSSDEEKSQKKMKKQFKITDKSRRGLKHIHHPTFSAKIQKDLKANCVQTAKQQRPRLSINNHGEIFLKYLHCESHSVTLRELCP